MENYSWEILNRDNFNIFIRDLSSSVNINLKHMIEDLLLDKTKLSDKGNQKKSKKKVIKKADLIIQNQKKLKYKIEIEKDEKICKFLMENLDDKDPYSNFDKLKTEEGKLEYKFKLLERYWKKKSKYLSHVLILYFHLKHIEYDKLSDKRKKIMDKINIILNEYDYKYYMFENLGHQLPPLNFWDKGNFKFDDWQIDVIRKIKNKKSVFVRAPTSSGKTFIAMACGIFHKKVVYVCPAKPVAYQIGSHFIKMGYKVHFMLEDHATLTFDDKTNIFVGTPELIEKYIYRTKNNFDYAVYDEIHNLTKEYENIIHLLNCNFLILSATISNPENVIDQFQMIHPQKKIEYVEYNQRFINQQRWIWNSNKLNKLHPCICLNLNEFNKFNEISFTPNDCAILYKKLGDEFEDHKLEEYIDSFSPDIFFKDEKLLTLDDSKYYETILKKELECIYKDYPDKIKNVINLFQNEYKIDNKNDYVHLFQKCKKKDMLPMILFHTKEKGAKDIFQIVYDELKKTELNEYPYHYDILEKKQSIYDDYTKKKEIYSSTIKIKTKDAQTEKNEKLLEFDKNEKQKYISLMIDYYQKCIEKCKDTLNEKNKIKNLSNEMDYFISNSDFRHQDVFKKHPEFCFTHLEPMSGDEIKKIRREINKAIGKKLDYDEPLFQLLKRGIGIYVESNPEEYNWTVQRLMSQKKLGIIISDKTLCLGIDLPIRSVCFTGYNDPNFTKEDYLQMSGRAGRRGQDNQGNIIFHNIENYKELMSGVLPELNFKNDKLYPSYQSITQLNPNFNTTKLQLNDELVIKNKNTTKLLWYLRYYQNSSTFVNSLDDYERKIFMIDENDREISLFQYVLEILLDKNKKEYIESYKQKLIPNELKTDFIEIGNIFKDICNSLHYMKYKIIVDNSIKIFNIIKNL